MKNIQNTKKQLLIALLLAPSLYFLVLIYIYFVFFMAPFDFNGIFMIVEIFFVVYSIYCLIALPFFYWLSLKLIKNNALNFLGISISTLGLTLCCYLYLYIIHSTYQQMDTAYLPPLYIFSICNSLAFWFLLKIFQYFKYK